MEPKRKWIGLILIIGILVITAAALGMNTLYGGSPQNDSTLQQYEATLRTLFHQNGELDLERLDSEGGFVYRAGYQGRTTGYAVQQTVQGYGGPIEVITAVDTAGVIQGISVGGADFRETEGLGAKAKEPDFTEQFRSKQLPVALGSQIDAIAGATVTSQAVVDAVNLTLTRIQDQPDFLPAPASTTAPEANDSSGMTANASAIGYGGPVLVRLTLNDQGKIAALDVGGARFSETEGVGSRVKDEAFVQQFIGLTPPLNLNEDVDAVSGATISSQAVVDAVNDAAAFLMQKEEPSDTN